MSSPYPQTPTDTTSPEMTPPAGRRRKNVIGLIALITSIVGFVFACIPGALIVGWVLLPTAFILGIVGVALSGRRKAASVSALIIAVVGTIVAVVVFVTAVVGAVDDAFDGTSQTSGEDAVPGDESPSQDDPADDEAAEGTRDNPLSAGDTMSTDDWTIVLDTPYEATDDVLGENPFNDPPADGSEYWILPITATYTGDDTGEPMLITTAFVSADGHTYDEGNSDCGVIPDPLDAAGELYADASATGNVCLEVPAGADGLWSISADILDEPVFFAAE